MRAASKQENSWLQMSRAKESGDALAPVMNTASRRTRNDCKVKATGTMQASRTPRTSSWERTSDPQRRWTSKANRPSSYGAWQETKFEDNNKSWSLLEWGSWRTAPHQPPTNPVAISTKQMETWVRRFLRANKCVQEKEHYAKWIKEWECCEIAGISRSFTRNEA